jgi:hypothetical protein
VDKLKGNIVGSQETVSLNKKQREVLIGTILGDGTLEKNGSNVRLRIDHALKDSQYVTWKYRIFKNMATSQPRIARQYDRRKSKIYYHFKFDTLSLKYLNQYRKLFYRNRRKVVPKDISKKLRSGLSLAVWFMDDGYNRCDCKGMYFNTQGFSEEEHELLQQCLRDNFDLETTIHWAAGRPRIYVPARESPKLCQVIRPYIVPSMNYKIL